MKPINNLTLYQTQNFTTLLKFSHFLSVILQLKFSQFKFRVKQTVDELIKSIY